MELGQSLRRVGPLQLWPSGCDHTQLQAWDPGVFTDKPGGQSDWKLWAAGHHCSFALDTGNLGFYQEI